MKKLFFVSICFFGLLAFAQVNDDGTPYVHTDPGVATEDSSRAPGSLSTIFAGGNGFAGNMFDVEVTTALTIEGFDVNVDIAATGTIQLYYRLGTCVGNETNAAAWTLYGQDINVVGQGASNPTPVNISGLALDPGQVYGFYIHEATYNTLRVNYTNGAPTVYTNAEHP